VTRRPTSHERTDLRPATVHDDRKDADRLQEDDVLGEALERTGFPHGCEVAVPHGGAGGARSVATARSGEGVTAVLDDDGAPREAPNVRQRVAEHGRLHCCGQLDRAHDRPMLSST
jgi:hypothetical protein